jgi:hypothetical protein
LKLVADVKACVSAAMLVAAGYATNRN